MKVKRSVEVSFSITVFDDNKKWVHVEVCQSGRAARTVFQSRAVEHLLADDLESARTTAEALVTIAMHEELRRQQLLF